MVLNGSLLQLVPLSDFMCIDLLIARLLIKQVICSASALREVRFPGAASCQLLCFEWQMTGAFSYRVFGQLAVDATVESR